MFPHQEQQLQFFMAKFSHLDLGRLSNFLQQMLLSSIRFDGKHLCNAIFKDSQRL